MAMAQQALTFDEFREQLARTFEIPVDSLHSDTHFLEDLALDSLRMLQLGMALEHLGVGMPDEMAWEIQTVGEAYAYYAARHASHAQDAAAGS